MNHARPASIAAAPGDAACRLRAAGSAGSRGLGDGCGHAAGAARRRFAATELKLTGVTRIENVGRQVVAGMNYRFDIVLANGRRWRVTVWQKLDDTQELTAAAQIGA